MATSLGQGRGGVWHGNVPPHPWPLTIDPYTPLLGFGSKAFDVRRVCNADPATALLLSMNVPESALPILEFSHFATKLLTWPHLDAYNITTFSLTR